MAVAVASFSSYFDTGSVTAHGPQSLPSGTAEGDLLLAIQVGWGAKGNIWDAEAGWTLEKHQGHDDDEDTAFYAKFAGASEGNPTFDTSGQSMLATGLLMRITGHDPASLAAAVHKVASLESNNQNPVCPSVTTTVDGCLIINIITDGFDDSADKTIPANTTQIASISGHGNQSFNAVWWIQDTAGATGTKTFTGGAGDADQFGTYTIAIAPATVGGGGGSVVGRIFGSPIFTTPIFGR